MHSFSHMAMFIADFFFAMSLYVSSLVLYPSFLIHWSCPLPAKESIFSITHQNTIKAILCIFRHFYCIPLSPPPNVFNLMIGIFGVYQHMGIPFYIYFLKVSLKLLLWNLHSNLFEISMFHVISPGAKSNGKRTQIMIIPINSNKI